MNFGLTGSIAERVLLVLKDRNGIEAAEHRHRPNEASDLADRGGGIVGEDAVLLKLISNISKSISLACTSHISATPLQPLQFFCNKIYFFQSTFQHNTSFAMGTQKKEANRKIKQGKVGDGMANVK